MDQISGILQENTEKIACTEGEDPPPFVIPQKLYQIALLRDRFACHSFAPKRSHYVTALSQNPFILLRSCYFVLQCTEGDPPPFVIPQKTDQISGILQENTEKDCVWKQIVLKRDFQLMDPFNHRRKKQITEVLHCFLAGTEGDPPPFVIPQKLYQIALLRDRFACYSFEPKRSPYVTALSHNPFILLGVAILFFSVISRLGNFLCSRNTMLFTLGLVRLFVGTERGYEQHLLEI
ncbi:hypothetical protein CEXT_350961 [Caerostris extrusa]|uniref:Uncharacterized protein n=1 Tax=Caerostris extrusa TaxID=172846 RepID=A0AAV4MM17_CAEEX|nr:hypothetical protein CEXT_350961 [Caerostris extrusa]